MSKKEHLKYIAIILGVIACVAFLFSGVILSCTFNTESVEQYVFEYVNLERTSRGLPALGDDTNLCGIAKGWANSMTETGVLEHGNFSARIKSINYNEYRCGEIIENYSIPFIVMSKLELYNNPADVVAKDLVNGWLNSPPHKEIMLSPEGGDMGVAVSRRGLGSYFAVVDFKFT